MRYNDASKDKFVKRKDVNCPSCRTPMKSKGIECGYGSATKIHQCSSCRGLWGDQWGILKIDPDRALDVIGTGWTEPMDHQKSDLICPECSTGLDKIKDPFIPGDIDFFSCHKCHGIWMDAKSFLGYNRWRKKKRETVPEEISHIPDEVRLLIANEQIKRHGKGKNLEKAGALNERFSLYWMFPFFMPLKSRIWAKEIIIVFFVIFLTSIIVRILNS